MRPGTIITVLAFNRPALLERCLASLPKASVLICVDGGAEPAVLELAQRHEHVLFGHHFGSSQAQVEAVSAAFARGAEHVFYTDSDVEFVPGAVSLLDRLTQWCELQTLQRCVVCSDVTSSLSSVERKAALSHVRFSQATGTHFLTSARSWSAAEPVLRYLVTLVGLPSARKRLAHYAEQLPANWPDALRDRHMAGKTGTAGDSMRQVAFGLTGTRIVSLVVPRAKHHALGGVNTPCGNEHETLVSYPSDAVRNEFDLVSAASAAQTS